MLVICCVCMLADIGFAVLEKSKAVSLKPATSRDATTPLAPGRAAYDHQATGAGRGKATMVLASVDGKKVTSLPRAGAGGNT